MRQNTLRPGSTNVIDVDEVVNVLSGTAFPTEAVVTATLLHPNGSTLPGASGLPLVVDAVAETYRVAVPYTVPLTSGLIYTLVVQITVDGARTEWRERIPCLALAA